MGGGIQFPDVANQMRYLGLRNYRGGAQSAAEAAAQITAAQASVVPGVYPGFKMINGVISKNSKPTLTIANYITWNSSIAKAGWLAALEGINEPGNQEVDYNGVSGGRVAGVELPWQPMAEFMRDFYKSVKSAPALAIIPVYGVSEAGAEEGDYNLHFTEVQPAGLDPSLGGATSLPPGTKYSDTLNVHNYVGGGSAGGGILHPNQAWSAATRTVHSPTIDDLPNNNGITWAHHYPGYSPTTLPTIRAVTTETGLQTEDPVFHGPGFFPEDDAGKILLNVFFAQYKHGFEKTCLYDYMDDSSVAGAGQKFGIYHNLGGGVISPKLAANYIHNMTTILADVKKAGLTGISYQAVGPVTFHDLLLQRSDGHHFLVIWNERVPNDGGSDLVPIDLGQIYSKVNFYDPVKGIAAQSTLSNAQVFSVTLTDHPLILEIVN